MLIGHQIGDKLVGRVLEVESDGDLEGSSHVFVISEKLLQRKWLEGGFLSMLRSSEKNSMGWLLNGPM